ncbi:hypothetical protein [Curtobacterium luteum]|uniref:hypothetical protein n=1 Tax=Curtobacterium luteum TaxID=33881 RepID=UPI00381E29E7
MDSVPATEDAVAEQLALLQLLGVDIPTSREAVVAKTVDQWRTLAYDLMAAIRFWPADYADAAPLDSDGSLQVQSALGFGAAVMLLAALGPTAIPKSALHNARFTSVNRIADLVYAAAQASGATDE